jgi:hypothetical protein
MGAFGRQESRSLRAPDAAAGLGSAHPSPDVVTRHRFGDLAPTLDRSSQCGGRLAGFRPSPQAGRSLVVAPRGEGDPREY